MATELPVGGQVIYIPLAFFPDDGRRTAWPFQRRRHEHRPAMWSFSTSNLPAPQGGHPRGHLDHPRREQRRHAYLSWLPTYLACAATVLAAGRRAAWPYCGSRESRQLCLACSSTARAAVRMWAAVCCRCIFDTTILPSGSDENPLQWSGSIINHEIGHFVMDQQYSWPPGEVGIHYLSAPESPGLAWSEGYAWDGRRRCPLSSRLQNPIYFAVQQGDGILYRFKQRHGLQRYDSAARPARLH